ncbi:MAG: adenylate/guanylate cyclase domain-containing protein [Spirulinaceae cyanobacterium]
MVRFFNSKNSLSTWLTDKVKNSWDNLAELKIVTLGILLISSSLLGLRYLGYSQALELLAFDQLVRWQKDLPPDQRILLVTIAEEDLRQQKDWPIPDLTYAQVLENLQAWDAKVIGLDIYRDLPVEKGRTELIKQLQEPNVFAIRSIDIFKGTPAPPELPPEKVGFNDIPVDPDGVIRRNIIFAIPQGEEFLTSFALLLASAYLEDQDIKQEESEENPEYLQLGEATFIPLTPNSGGYQNVDAGGYQVLFDYRNRHQVATEVSFDDVVLGNIDPDLVKDKIVIIGSTAPSLKDAMLTPYSRGLLASAQMPGVIIHAQSVSQILDAATGERPLRWFWSEWVEGLWIVAWVALGGVVGWLLRHPLSLTISAGVGLGILLSTATVVFFQAGWIPLASPAIGFFLTIGVAVTYQSYQDHQQHQMVMKLLGQNTSPEIANALWQGRDYLLKSGKLPGKKLTATTMFVDIKGFSTISEKMPPENLLNWLNELLDVMTREVIKREGAINKFTGDGLMAVFGVPLSHFHTEEIQTDAQHCVNCALAISDRLEEMNANWLRRGLPVIQIRIGIFTGAVVVGSLGGKDRLEYGVIGDSVNIAARLEGCEKDRQPSNCRILIAKETLVHLKEKVEVEAWGLIALKGKEQMVDVYRVTGRLLPKSRN